MVAIVIAIIIVTAIIILIIIIALVVTIAILHGSLITLPPTIPVIVLQTAVPVQAPGLVPAPVVAVQAPA